MSILKKIEVKRSSPDNLPLTAKLLGQADYEQVKQSAIDLAQAQVDRANRALVRATCAGGLTGIAVLEALQRLTSVSAQEIITGAALTGWVAVALAYIDTIVIRHNGRAQASGSDDRELNLKNMVAPQEKET